MSKIILSTDIEDADIVNLRIGDIVYLSGTLVTARDAVHERLLREGRDLPFSLAGKAILHAGPIMRNLPDGTFETVSIGPTTSMRMEALEAEFIAETGVKLVIGKGGMGAKTAAACRKYRALHCVFPGGCAVLAATHVEKVESVDWLDLGMPEALWRLQVREFGPLIVSIDCAGQNLFEDKKIAYNARKAEIIKTVLTASTNKSI
ncbi:MAG: L(+)-tartrate dehydratase subunit beta [Clostridiaceae bacterium]|nr:L(+)-tartrate dehydratase subunit beta [Clostridiaceae bacterium]